MPQEQRMWQKDHPVIGNDTKFDPEVAQKGTKGCTKMPKKNAFFSSLLVQSLARFKLAVLP